MKFTLKSRSKKWVTPKWHTLVMFLFVIFAATFVVVLRNKTLALGYELANLKSKEKALREENAQINADFAKLEKALHTKYVINSTVLQLPQPQSVIYLPLN